MAQHKLPKATIYVDPEIWPRFRARCIERGTSASEELRKVMARMVYADLYGNGGESIPTTDLLGEDTDS